MDNNRQITEWLKSHGATFDFEIGRVGQMTFESWHIKDRGVVIVRERGRGMGDGRTALGSMRPARGRQTNDARTNQTTNSR